MPYIKAKFNCPYKNEILDFLISNPELFVYLYFQEIDALDGVDSPRSYGETSEALPKQTDDAPNNDEHQDSSLSQAVESTTDVTSTPSGLVDGEHGIADSTNGETGND